MLSKRRRQPKQQRKKGLFSKTKNFARAAHFFLYFFACVLHDDNVELPETSWVHVLCRKCCLRSCSLFFRCRSFLPWWPLAVSHFLTAAVKFSCYSSNEIGLLCLFISGSSSFSVIHANVDFKIKSKDWELASLLLLFLSLLSPGGYTTIYCRNARILEMQNFNPVYMKGWTYVGTYSARLKIAWMNSLPNFLGHGAPLRALRARELRLKGSE